MTAKDCTPFHILPISIMNTKQQDEKDISKVFTCVRTQLQAKEKELMQLQQSEPSLLAPDSDQIHTLLDTIASLHLSTQDGSFVFQSNSVCDDSPSVSSTDFESIKTLSFTVWLPQSRPMKQHNGQRLSMFNHLLTLPINAYLAPPSANYKLSSFKSQNQPRNRLPMVNHLLCMPISAFKPSSNTSVATKKVNNVIPTTETTKSILNTEMIYSKEYWLRNTSSAYEIACHT